MSEIIIPDRMAARLAHDKTWDSCVTQFTKNIEPLLAKDPDFFPDYTIHGIDHINRVLDIADYLIDYDTLSEEPQKTDLLTPRDVAFLVCGITLHDMGMFLRPDGLRKLVKMDRSDDAFGGKPWKDEWSNYVDRTKRLSQEKMRYHFGKVIPVTEDCVDHTDTDDNKRIIGEFLRQHHARLAHEFALGMLPGTEDTDLFANINLPPKARDVIGILARSHSMAIRDIELYVKNHIGEGTKPYNTPVFYLMTVLRTADALDADERRAPEALERQQEINVPISVEEWTWNQCIDPYACDWRKQQKNYYVEANPKSSPQYVQLDKWLKGVQADLDLCWSILAEKYPYDRYRLSIHRVVSNIHEPGIRETMNETFLTKEAKITANPEIVKLMMEPLYGDDPTYGVRELLQNAVDACLERGKWEKDHGNPNYKGLVDIRIENGVFTITDNGMGMNEDVLLNYYLSAGSSYRSSDAWAAANTKDGKSQVARTGKFGVGFLASFLLGDEIQVHTQHREDQKGYQFKFDQESSPLDIQRADRAYPYAADVNDPTHAGTTITIKLKATAIRRFNSNNYNYPWYNWYAFDEPKVRYFIGGKEMHHHGLHLHRDPKKNTGWLTLPSENSEVYQWNPHLNSAKPEFYCNGIRIYGTPMFLEKCGIHFSLPHISVIDKYNSLDVDLSRQSLKSFPQHDALIREVFRWHIAHLLITPWDNELHCRTNCTFGFSFDSQERIQIPFILSRNGYTLNHASILPLLNLKDYVILYYDGASVRSAIKTTTAFLAESTPCCIVASDENEQTKPFFAHINQYRQYLWDKPEYFIQDLLTGKNFLFKRSAIQYDIHNLYAAVWLHADIEKSISIQQQDAMDLSRFVPDRAIRTSYHKHRPSQMPIDRHKFPAHDFPVTVHVIANSKSIMFSPYIDSLFTQTFCEILTPAPDYPDQSLWIPFDMAERKKKFPKAFEELAVYMDHIRKYPIE